MQVPTQITIRDLPNSAAIENKIQEKVNKLSRYSDQIAHCHVIVEVPQKHQHQGKIYTVRIDLKIPGKEVVVSKIFNEDLYVAIRDAFNAARRQIEDHVRRERGDVKAHQERLHGQIARLVRDEEYGFITTNEGKEYYFHASNLLTSSFAMLTIGSEVEFFEVTAGDGLQAGHISLVDVD